MAVIQPTSVRLGLERCRDEPPDPLRGARFGLLMNQASVDSRWRYACDLLADQFPGQLTALFAPQHGLWCEQQANMIESPHGHHGPLDIPIYSLYSETRQPTEEMLRGLDCLVIDLQDVGTRVYTFAWTVVNCLRACAAHARPVILLDRPNPLGGVTVEGPVLQPDFRSFVGLAEIPMRHALTIGELALWANAELEIGAELNVVPMTGWQREMLLPATQRAWTPPSPNMPRFETALVYPGQVLLEGTNLSEGRGTTSPFEWTGAPFIDPFLLCEELESLPHPGLSVRPIRFVPTFDKWQGQSCGGVSWHVTDPSAVRSFIATLSLVAGIQRLWPERFAWLPPPYEYETEKMPIDILYGSSEFREALARGKLDAARIEELAHVEVSEWHASTALFRLYD
jgi:uncharacterized protein YbbC (DUF1343 family)